MEAAETNAIVAVEPDWSTIQARYLDGEQVRDIAADYGITANAIYHRAYRNHWREQQFKRLEKARPEVEAEVRGCITVSVLKEARAFQREDPSPNAIERDTFSKARERLWNLATRIFGWEQDPVANAKPARCLDV